MSSNDKIENNKQIKLALKLITLADAVYCDQLPESQGSSKF